MLDKVIRFPRDTSRFMRRTLGIRKKPDHYWQSRKDQAYLREIRALVADIGANAQSILDVGSNGCAYLDWFNWIPRRVSIDLCNPYQSPAVESIRADFLAHAFRDRFDLCLCLQVLEHIPDAAAFARKLLTSAPNVIVSVPYLWPVGRCANHVNDPVDETKIMAWFGREPNRRLFVQEPGGRAHRMICHFSD